MEYKYEYYLPKENGVKKKVETEKQAIIIIGANGAGKSHLGAWMECADIENTHRISAQRNLNFNNSIVLKSYSEAEDIVFFGNIDVVQKEQKGYRWQWGKYTTTLLDDFENVLAALIAMKNNDNEEFVNKCKEADEQGKSHPKTPLTSIDKLQIIWRKIFPQRDLIIRDSKFFARFIRDNEEIEYPANEMSDGERSALYLMAQVLCVPPNKKLIIDEPEIHLHRSLMNKIWIELENYRKDCLFVYITHDTQFASLHNHAEKIWIKSYDGENWEFEMINSLDLPEELLLNILGNRKNVLFVEGEPNSYDTRLYSLLYPSYYVIPCGGCSQVIQRTKIFNQSPQLHHCKVYGIIDRDYRSKYEIDKYKNDNIFTLEVAEVENLFLIEPLIRYISKYLCCDSNLIFKKIKNYVINERFKKQLESQIYQNVVAEIKYNLINIEISHKNPHIIRENLDTIMTSINYEKIIKECTDKFNSVLNEDDYKAVLKIFNEKGISYSIGHFFDIKNDRYCELIIDLLNTGESPIKQTIKDALAPYLPSEITMN